MPDKQIMDKTYQPVACALHSEYELLAMHRSKVLINGIDNQGMALKLQCHVKDIRTSQGAEYLVAIDNENNVHQFRLDQIISIDKLNE